MDWVRNFYSCQNEWFGVYLSDINQCHLDRVALVDSSFKLPRSRLLELGAGGGQTAVALAKSGYQVSMIELLEKSVRHAHKLKKRHQQSVQIFHGDFYTIKLDKQFDIICYFDSFGIGEDKDQVRLLQKIETWLAPKGKVLIEIGAPQFWSGVAHGKITDLGACIRQYEYDFEQQRLIDYWWLKSAPQQKIFQSLRCYCPEDFNRLLEGTNLKVEHYISGGKIDFEQFSFIKKVPLEEAMTYYALLKKE